jgi:CHAT domain-containing protein
MRASGWHVTVLAAEAAIHADVLTGLATADWLHYAGHGFSTTGWDSALPLAGEAELDVRSVVALPRVPGAVVLSGCRTGTIDDRDGAGGQHLAAAFLLAGSRFVIATSADLEDEDGVTVATALYSALQRHPAMEGAELLRTAMLEANARHGFVAWRHYRAWQP